MKNMKAFVRMMVVSFSGTDLTAADLSTGSKTPVATIRELLTFAIEKGFIVESVKNHKIVFNITKSGEDFAGYLKGYKEIFIDEEEKAPRKRKAAESSEDSDN